MPEIWKDIEGYEGWYQVSSLGRVRSVDRDVKYSDGRVYHKKGTILQPRCHKNGYYQVVLYKNGNREYPYIHRLVAQAFLPNDNDELEVNHKDEDIHNNNVENLEWCTHQYNLEYGTRKERQIKATSKSIHQLDLDGNIIKRWNSIRDANREIAGANGGGNISKVLNGTYHTAYGYRWEYAE